MIALTLAVLLSPGLAQDPRPVVGDLADLPERRYELTAPVAEVADSDKLRTALCERARADLGSDLAHFEFADAAVEQEVWRACMQLDLALGRDDDVRLDLARIAELEEVERLVSALPARAWLDARAELGPAAEDEDRAAFDAAYLRHLETRLADLSPDAVRQHLQRRLGRIRMLSEGILAMGLSGVAEEFDGEGSIDAVGAAQVAALYAGRRILLPRRDAVTAAYEAFLGTEEGPDIWSERAVTLRATDLDCDRVVVAIWDTGVDVELFEGRLWEKPGETANGEDDDGDGLADDLHGFGWVVGSGPTANLLNPIEDRRALNRGRRLSPDFEDLRTRSDSPGAVKLRARLAALTPAEIDALAAEAELFGYYAHGTHVAGIALDQNPFARLFVARASVDPDAVWDEAWAESMAAGFRETVKRMRAAGVRVANLSWGWGVAEIEQNLAEHEPDVDRATPATRRARAERIHAVLDAGLHRALTSAQGILFVNGAGNSGEAIERDRWVPARYADLENLIVVGAVDRAGWPTAFTSFGPTVAVYADGWRVESVVPGGRKLAWSGTSMSAPQVTNLAAKLFAVDPELWPADVIALVVGGAEVVERNGRSLRLIHPKRSLELLAPGPYIEYLGTRPLSREEDPDGMFVRLALRLSNPTDEAVVFSGYGPESPLYEVEHRVDGVWESGALGWCGTGLGHHALAPGGSLELEVMVARDAFPARVTLVLLPPARPDEVQRARRIASPAVELP